MLGVLTYSRGKGANSVKASKAIHKANFLMTIKDNDSSGDLSFHIFQSTFL
jgi:hypothetical protein